MRKRTNVRLKDIAEVAGVSIPVVSVALSKKTNSTTKLTKETAERIQKIAADLNYKPDIFGRSLRANKSFLVGVLLYSVNSNILGEFIRGVQKGFADSDYSPLFLTHATKSEQRRNLELCMRRKFCGLIFNTWIDEEGGETDHEFTQGILPENMPLLEVFGRNFPESVSVNFAFKESFYNLCVHLLQSGYKKISMILHEKYTLGRTSGMFFDAWECFEGYEQAMKESGKAVSVLTHSLMKKESYINWVESAYKIICERFEQGDLPDAVVCMHDEQAVGILKACREKGVRVPEDLAVACFGDSRVCQFSIPSLTTCRTSCFEFGVTASKTLLQIIDKEPVRSQKIKTGLQLRESC